MGKELKFGTSGLRDTVENMTDMECYINTRGFIEYLRNIEEFEEGTSVALASDRRPSSPRIKRAVAKAVKDMGGEPDDQGLIPSPALALYAIKQGIPSIMVTGSHIPADRNGIKFTKISGEVLKSDEQMILDGVKSQRKKVVSMVPEDNIFDEAGMFTDDTAKEAEGLLIGHEMTGEALSGYLLRYKDIFAEDLLPEGTKIFLYQHSAVGRDIAKDIFESIGAEVVAPEGSIEIEYKDDSGQTVKEEVPLRSKDFVSVDTESVSNKTMAVFEKVMNDNNIDIGISLDGDSDRPLLVYRSYDGDEPTKEIKYVTGDILGLLAVLGLEALDINVNAVCIPVSANDSIQKVMSDEGIEITETKIGSPYVIDAMNASIEATPDASWTVCSWESNGGFLLGTEVSVEGKTLDALPTRDAILPLILVINLALSKEFTISDLLGMLPGRYTHADRKKDFPLEKSRAVIDMLTPSIIEGAKEVEFGPGNDIGITGVGDDVEVPDDLSDILNIKDVLEEVFQGEDDFLGVVKINYIDGIRVYFEDGEISHLRPSGNAPEFRNYAIADSPERAREMVKIGLEKVIPALAEKVER